MSRKNMRLEFPHYKLELEAKFLTDYATIRKILADLKKGAPFIPEPIRVDLRRNIYADTKAFRLTGLGIEVRSRENGGGKYKHDLKAPYKMPKDRNGGKKTRDDGVFIRREYRSHTYDNRPYLRDFDKPGLKKVLTSLFDKDLEKKVQGYFSRDRLEFSPAGFSGSRLEIALENGFFETIDEKHRSKKLYIVELELKKGSPDAFLETAWKLEKRYKLNLCPFSKGEMGMAFAAAHMSKKDRARYEEALARREGSTVMKAMTGCSAVPTTTL